MIPKIIHYTWFSGEAFPPIIQKCINSWRQIHPDWTFKQWDMEAIKDIDSVFLKEALSVRKWAYAADYVRLYALYTEGGVYLDTDAMLLKSLDDFLEDKAFIGKENSIHFTGRHSAQYLSSHCMGAEKGHPFIKDCLSYFEGRHFIQSTNEHLPATLRFNQILLPYIQAEIAKQYGYDARPLSQTIQRCKEGLIIYPTDYFDVAIQTPNNVCQHLALGSWREKTEGDDIKYNIWFKLKWRYIALFQWILKNHNYITMEIE